MSSLDPVILSEVKKIQKAQSNVTQEAGAWPVDKIDILLSSQSYTVPETGTYRVLVVGGGGSGGRWESGKATGGGAGGFRYAEVALTVGQILTATIGAGGAIVYTNGAGVSGGQSRLQLVDTGMDMIANGGGGGNAAIASAATMAGGVGGTATGSAGSTLVGRDVSNTGGSGGNKAGSATGAQFTGGGGVNYYGRPTNGGNSTYVSGTDTINTGGGGVGGSSSNNSSFGGGAGGDSNFFGPGPGLGTAGTIFNLSGKGASYSTAAADGGGGYAWSGEPSLSGAGGGGGGGQSTGGRGNLGGGGGAGGAGGSGAGGNGFIAIQRIK